jgi:ATPase subunit of ABC transporter with duplicated ATPase domains
MIAVNDVSMRYGSKVLFDEVTTAFLPGRRYGLTGPNGAGKSTFMKLLTGELPPQRGNVVRPAKLGVLKQDQFAFDHYRVIDTVIMGNALAALEEREFLYAKADMTHEDGMRLGELEGIVGEEDGYTAESDAAILLQGLDIADGLHDRRMSELQGGQKVRVLLAQALFGHPQALLLDEPTNHLDLDSIHWLIDFLNRYDGTLIVISHDRHFLNAVCTHIADIDYQTIITYTGGYDDMVVAKTQIRTKIEADNEQREKKIAQLNDFIARFSSGTRSSQVQSRRKEVERLQTTELARSNIQRPYIRFVPARPSGRNVLDFKNVQKAYGAHVVVDGFHAIPAAARRSCWPAERPQQDHPAEVTRRAYRFARRHRRGHGEVGVAVITLSADHTGLIEKAHRFGVAAPLTQPAPRQDIHGLLGQMFMVRRAELSEALSAGETAACLLPTRSRSRTLIFDEPTNHLDLESINALNVALQKFEGTVHW